MGLPPDVTASLHALSADAGSDRDLVSGLQQLLEQTRDAVPSCLALSLTVGQGPLLVTLVAWSPLGTAVDRALSSLAVRLPAPGDPDIAASRALTVYAAEPGALVALAADLLALLDLNPDEFILDGHLDLPPHLDTVGALADRFAEVADIDRALGVLLDKGMPRDEANRELERLAAHHTTNVSAAARLVLDAARRPSARNGALDG